MILDVSNLFQHINTVWAREYPNHGTRLCIIDSIYSFERKLWFLEWNFADFPKLRKIFK